MGTPSSQRHQNFVNRKIQGSLLWRLAGYWLVYSLLLWHALFLWHLIDFGKTIAVQNGPTLSFLDLYVEFCKENARLAICAMAIFPLFFWDGLRLTHRIAGPLQRFRDALEKLTHGEAVAPLTLRRDDLLVEYQHAFNRYLLFLEQDHKSRAGLPRSTRAECETALEPTTNPLIKEVESIRAEIHQVASDAPTDS
ncbi:MAG: hypothetical protein KDA84_18970 [Planctomycetaceae bacterium]|nr:hypothetical protein [Planctomycetaceae bacterium]